MELIGCTETSVTTNVLCVTSREAKISTTTSLTYVILKVVRSDTERHKITVIAVMGS
jgi:hypothetical protein